MSALLEIFVFASLTPTTAAAGCPLHVAAGRTCEVPVDTHCRTANSRGVKPCASYISRRGSSMTAKEMNDIGDLIMENSAKLRVGRINCTGSLQLDDRANLSADELSVHGRSVQVSASASLVAERINCTGSLQLDDRASLSADELSVHGRSVQVSASASLVAKRINCAGSLQLDDRASLSANKLIVHGRSVQCAEDSKLRAFDMNIEGLILNVRRRAKVQANVATISSSSAVSLADDSEFKVGGKLNISSRNIVVNGSVSCNPCHLSATHSLVISEKGSITSFSGAHGGAIHITANRLTVDGLLQASARGSNDGFGGFIRVQAGLLRGNGSLQAVPKLDGRGGQVQVQYGDEGAMMPTVDVQNGGRSGILDIQQSEHLRASPESSGSMKDDDGSQTREDRASLTEDTASYVGTPDLKSAPSLKNGTCVASAFTVSADPSVNRQLLASASPTPNEDIQRLTTEAKHAEVDAPEPVGGGIVPIVHPDAYSAQVCSRPPSVVEQDQENGQCYDGAETLQIHAESSHTDHSLAAEDLLKQVQSIVENGFSFAGVKDMLSSLQGSLRVALGSHTSEECCSKYAVDNPTSSLIVVKLCKTGNRNKGSLPLIGWSSSRFSVTGNATYLRASDSDTLANLKKIVSVKGEHVFRKLMVEAGTA